MKYFQQFNYHSYIDILTANNHFIPTHWSIKICFPNRMPIPMAFHYFCSICIHLKAHLALATTRTLGNGKKLAVKERWHRGILLFNTGCLLSGAVLLIIEKHSLAAGAEKSAAPLKHAFFYHLDSIFM